MTFGLHVHANQLISMSLIKEQVLMDLQIQIMEIRHKKNILEIDFKYK